MNFFSNTWKHPKTSTAGLLIAVATIAGTLSRQGITLGSAGNGTVVTLAGALASALLGLLARDPASANENTTNSGSSSSTSKLGAWALIALLLPLPWMSGCSAKCVAQEIVNWTPSLQNAVATVDSTAAMLAPADAPIFAEATAGFDAASDMLVAQAKAYLANPTASVLAQLQTAVAVFQQQVNASLLSAAKIANLNSQRHVMNAINEVATIVVAILALVSSISSKAALARMAAQSTVKLAAVEPYRDEDRAASIVAGHYDESARFARVQVTQAELSLAEVGF